MEAVGAMLGPDSSGGRLFARGLANVRGLLAGAPALGVRVLAGTDTQLPHGAVAAEVARLVDYGLAPADAVHAASTAAYDHLGHEGRAFTPGHPADVVFFDRDPREDVGALARPVFGLRHGRVVVDRRGTVPEGGRA
jgi:imidazolonepropionase-like amidohydrolase